MSYDVSEHLHQRDVAELGGAAGKVLADWLLRISPAEARRRARITEPFTERTTLTDQKRAPRQPAAAEAWRAGALDGATAGGALLPMEDLIRMATHAYLPRPVRWRHRPSPVAGPHQTPGHRRSTHRAPRR